MTRLNWALLVVSLPAVCAAQPIPGRYIIELSGEPAARNVREGARQFALRREAISRQQEQVKAAVARRGGRVLASMDTALNALVVDAGPEGASALAAMPGVLAVHQDVMVHARLDRVLALSEVPAAFQKIGGASKAGAGMKIAILDTGIDASHPGFQDDSLAVPAGFPKTSSDANKAYVNKKVIVARSYEDLAADDGYGVDAADRNGHGTNAACAASCVVHEALVGTISGVAPKAFLAAYKVLGNNGGGPQSAILKGVDDAVKDGCDVLNLSLGSDVATDPAGDLQVKALNAAADAGAIVLAAAGNAGPDENTINSPGTAEKAITVGSSSSDRAFNNGATPINPNRLSDFSSRGPSVSVSLKPDMLATGDNFFTADTTLKDGSEGYTITQGTSFATPAVAGGAALLKAARPGLTSAQYRSLLVNSSTPIELSPGKAAPVRHQGAGRFNMKNALDMPIAVEPVSIALGQGGAAANITRELTVSNVSGAAVNLKLGIVPYDERTAPTVSPASATVAPNGSVKVTVTFSGSGLTGEYQGALGILNDRNDVITVVPYHYTVPATTAAAITLLEAVKSGAAGADVQFFARVLDGAGNTIVGAPLTATSGAGGGKVRGVEAAGDAPGVFIVGLTLGGAGDNVFTLRSGGATREVTIPAQ